MENSSLQQAITLIKSGDKVNARIILLDLIKNEQNNETALLWLTACVNTNEEKKYYLGKVLAINPENIHAKTALTKLAPTIQNPSLEEITSASSNKDRQNNRGNSGSFFVNDKILGPVLIVTICLILFFILVAILFNKQSQISTLVIAPTTTFSFPPTWTPKAVIQNTSIAPIIISANTTPTIDPYELVYYDNLNKIMNSFNNGGMDLVVDSLGLYQRNDPGYSDMFIRGAKVVIECKNQIDNLTPPKSQAGQELHKLAVDGISHFGAATLFIGKYFVNKDENNLAMAQNEFNIAFNSLTPLSITLDETNKKINSQK